MAGGVTATPAAGDTLQDMVLQGGPEEIAFVIWGGQIADMRLGMTGVALGDIVYATGSAGNHDIAIASTTSSAGRVVVNTPHDESDPTWINDGQRIAFEVLIGSDREIYRAQPDGSGLRNMTQSGMPPNNAQRDPAGAYADDEVLIADDSDSDGDLEIWRLEIDGGSTTKLTNNAVPDAHPAWSPTNGQIVYAQKVGTNWDLHIANQSGGADHTITSGAGPEIEPAWSPDGTRIAYAARVSGNWDVYSCNIDGSDVDRLTANPADDRHPSWSPDGSRIVFSSMRSGNGDIYVMNADGSSETSLVGGPAEDMEPEWNPAAQMSRTFVGPAGSDGGVDPPFGSTPLDLAIIIGGDPSPFAMGLRCSGPASDIQVRDVFDNSYIPALIGVSIHTPGTIILFAQETGRGRPLIRYIRDTGTNAQFVGDFDNVLVVFDPHSGRLMGLVPWRGAPNVTLPLDVSVIAPEPTVRVQGSEIIIAGPDLGAPGGGTCQEIVYEMGTGRLLSYR